MQTTGLTRLNGGSLTAGGLVDLEGGVLAGAGTVNANLFNNAEVDVGGGLPPVSSRLTATISRPQPPSS